MLTEQPLCANCEQEGQLVTATDVDHIDNDPSNNDRENLVGLCHACHSIKTRVWMNENNAAAAVLPLWMPRPRVPVTVVCGRPASGKSTYVSERASASDMVLDLDCIAAEIGRCGLYHRVDARDYHAALAERNKRLASLSAAGPQPDHCWLIATAGSLAERIFWRYHLGAELIVLDVPLDVCLMRIASDARRPTEAKLRHEAVARRWR